MKRIARHERNDFLEFWVGKSDTGLKKPSGFEKLNTIIPLYSLFKS